MSTLADDRHSAAVDAAGPPSRPTDAVKRPSTEAAATALNRLKAALASERQRTSDLRTEIDALQVALASSEEQRDAMRTERDRWAGRAQLLATAMAREASDVQNGVPGVQPAARQPNAQPCFDDNADVLAI